MNSPFIHQPVMPAEVISGLALRPDGRYLDATVGGGGHSRLILSTQPTAQVIALDQDEMALSAAQANLAEFKDRVQFWRGNFAHYDPQGVQFDGILADLGVSSPQLDTPERGFSFRHTAALDMRMDQRQPLSAADIINHWEEKKLADIFYTYGEERLSRRIARQIVAQRPFQTTTELAEAIASCVPGKYRHGRIHPATRVFQALRIAVNQELDVLERWLALTPSWLKAEGCLVIISFHSLEDRIVKHFINEHAALERITKKPLVASDAENAANPRARSAKLRIARKVPD
jgi:16S rRNA (cytosine1402-N4)-methyltransferase